MSKVEKIIYDPTQNTDKVDSYNKVVERSNRGLIHGKQKVDAFVLNSITKNTVSTMNATTRKKFNLTTATLLEIDQLYNDTLLHDDEHDVDSAVVVNGRVVSSTSHYLSEKKEQGQQQQQQRESRLLSMENDPSHIFRRVQDGQTQPPTFSPTIESSMTVSMGRQRNKNQQQQQQDDESNSGGFIHFILWVLVLGTIAYLSYRIYNWYKTKKEHERQAYRMAQADRVLGDMQMVPTSDQDENELL